MRLQKKISLAFAGVIVVFAAGSYLVLSQTLVPAFNELESQSAAQDLRRARNNLVARTSATSLSSQDWARWNDMFAYVESPNQEFEANNLYEDSLIALDVNLFAVFNSDGAPIWSLIVSQGSDIPETSVSKFLGKTNFQRLLRFEDITGENAGLIATESGPIYISSRPITNNDATRASNGTLIMGYLLDSAQLARLGEQARVALSLSAIEKTDQAGKADSNFAFLGRPRELVTTQYRENRLLLLDMDGEPLSVLATRSQRLVTELRNSTLASLAALLGALGTLLLLSLWFALKESVVKPVSDLRQRMLNIRRHRDPTERVNINRDDEVGDLAQAFDDMLQQLDDARQAHAEQSYKAGMAEVAAGVLHNVRNSLMPVLNHVSSARDRLDEQAMADLDRAADELQQGKGDFERQEKLLRFVKLLGETAAKRFTDANQDLDDALSQIDYVIEIVREQEKRSHAKPAMECIDVSTLINNAGAVIPADDDLAVDVEIDSSLDGVFVKAHRIALAQVFDNLLLNAYEAIKRTDATHGKIVVNAEAANDAEPQVRIVISDTGPGINSDVITRIFDRGYTSKEAGKGGLGLHWSANAIAGMDGTISASSDGSGTQFEITLQAA